MDARYWLAVPVIIPVTGAIAGGSCLAWLGIPEKGRRHPTLLETGGLLATMRNLSHRRLYFGGFDF